MEDAENLKRVNLKNEIANLKQIDLQVAESPASIPEDVASTMLSRMVPYVGIPMTLAASSFGFFYYQAKYQDTQYDTILVATVTVGFLVVGLLGITYSLFSANWDGDGGGSVDDFKQNLGSVQQGLRRGLIDNPKLREEALNMEENEENVDLETLNRARRREREGKGRKS
ncbi:hypothetical protein ScalyP_jg3236 [Parmales sp. scaly parma]|nr:hypothetical protein ScalyP_jg3236 [Parmales sp. scaly parma]